MNSTNNIIIAVLLTVSCMIVFENANAQSKPPFRVLKQKVVESPVLCGAIDSFGPQWQSVAGYVSCAVGDQFILLCGEKYASCRCVEDGADPFDFRPTDRPDIRKKGHLECRSGRG